MKRVNLPRRPGRWRDAAYDAAAVLSALVVGLGMTTGAHPPFEPYSGVAMAVAALSLAWRRRAPLTVAWIVAAGSILIPVVELVSAGSMLRGPGTIVWWSPAAPFAVYAVVVYTRNRLLAWVPVAVLAAAALLVGRVVPEAPVARAGDNVDTPEAVVFRSVALVVLAAVLGLYVATRRRVLRGLVERAERAERERYLLAERARAEERARLAAEMHDVVTHRVSLMVLQAGALRVTAPDESVRATAEELRATGCQALEELRDVVGLLRRDEEGRDAVPEPRVPVTGLAALVAESESAELVEEGEAPLASPVVARTAYRIVQEALTNVRKHAPGARAEVRVRYRADGVTVSVDSGPATRPGDPRLAAAGSGAGLAGLRQRVELIGGTFRSGPVEGGGFLVAATLPAFVPTTEQEPVG